jgi:hypothetical protein
MSHHNIVSYVAHCSVRRYSKTEDTSSFSQKRCIAWFREYTSADDPDVLGELMHESGSNKARIKLCDNSP